MELMEKEPDFIGPSRSALYTTLAVLLLSTIPGLLAPAAKPLAYLVPLVYLLVERKRAGRSWEEIGVKARTYGQDLLANWHLFLIVAIIFQLVPPLLARARWPQLLDHIRARVPLLAPSQVGALIASIVVIAFVEELIYRGLLQQRLAWYLRSGLAVLTASFLFALQHYTAGLPTIVAADLLLVFVDGLVYGWIFARCHNALVSWTAHVAADVVAVAILLLRV